MFSPSRNVAVPSSRGRSTRARIKRAAMYVGRRLSIAARVFPATAVLTGFNHHSPTGQWTASARYQIRWQCRYFVARRKCPRYFRADATAPRRIRGRNKTRDIFSRRGYWNAFRFAIRDLARNDDKDGRAFAFVTGENPLARERLFAAFGRIAINNDHFVGYPPSSNDTLVP